MTWTPTPPSARELAFTGALEPFILAAGRLFTPEVVAHLAAARPTTSEWIHPGTTSGSDRDLNSAMYPMRIRGLQAAGRVGAAHLIDSCAPHALWAWEVDDPVWDAALDVLDVAMHVAVLDLEGLPVTPRMRATHRLVMEVAG